MRPVTNGLTHGEWNLMEALWQKSPLTGRELTQLMEQAHGWNRSTTLTVVKRMCEKSQIAYTDETGIRQYYPLIPREEALQQETTSFLRRAYQGSVGLMVSALTQKQALSKAEIQELYEILRKAEEDAT